MQETKAKSYSLSERIRIVHEYETSGLTLKELSNKYGILGHSTMQLQFGSSKKTLPLHRDLRYDN